MRSPASWGIKPPAVSALVLSGTLLLSAAAAETPQQKTRAVFLVPDVGLVYFRYGEPGGVRIERTLGRTDTAPEDSLPRGRLPYSPELIGELLKEELRAYRSAAKDEGDMIQWARSPAPPPPAGVRVRTEPSAPPPTPSPQEPVAESIGDAARKPAPERVAPPPLVPAPLPSSESAPPTVDKEFIRRKLLLTGFLRTSHVIFETDKSTLMPYSHSILDAVAEVMEEFPAMRIRIEGHADLRGSEGHNLELSQRRAESVRRYIIEQFVIDEGRVEVKGFGETHPLVTGESETAFALNRRVEFRVLNLEEIRGE